MHLGKQGKQTEIKCIIFSLKFIHAFISIHFLSVESFHEIYLLKGLLSESLIIYNKVIKFGIVLLLIMRCIFNQQVNPDEIKKREAIFGKFFFFMSLISSTANYKYCTRCSHASLEIKVSRLFFSEQLLCIAENSPHTELSLNKNLSSDKLEEILQKYQ